MVERVGGPSQPGLMQRGRVVVAGNGPGDAADDPAEERACLVRLERMARSAALGEEGRPRFGSGVADATKRERSLAPSGSAERKKV